VGVVTGLTLLLGTHTPQNAAAANPGSHNLGANAVTWQTLKPAQRIPTSYKGRAETIAKLRSGAAPLAMASADFDRDGIADLVIGYAHSSGGILAVHRGNLDAFAPQSQASWLAIAHNQFPAPFLPQATLVEVPEAPQFIVTGDFDGDGDIDILTGAPGSQHLYLFIGNGKGKFAAPQTITLPGALTALAAGQVGMRDGKTDVVAGVQMDKAAAVLVYKGSAGGLAKTAVSYPVPQAATQLEIADLHGDGFSDVAVLAGAEVLVVHPTAAAGADTSALVERVPTAGARSIAVGGFVWDRHSRNQLAVLSQRGTVQVLSSEELDTRPFTREESLARRTAATRRQLPSELNPTWSGQSSAWNVVKSSAVSARLAGNVRLMAASLAHSRPLDLMVVDSSDSRLHVLPANATGDSANDAVELTVETGDSPLAVLPLRVNVDARRGLVMVGSSASQPKTMAPLPDPTFTVTRFDDPTPRGTGVTCPASPAPPVTNDCSLREAVIKANATAGADTIKLPAGTITLTITGQGEGAAATGDVDITDSLNITGSVDGGGNPTSIIQGCGGTSGFSCTGTDGATAWNDKFISVNKEGTSDANLSVSNVIFQNGNNTNLGTTESGFDALGGAVNFFGCGTAGGGCVSGSTTLAASSLTITNVQFLNNSIGNNASTGCSGSNNIDCGGGLITQFGDTTISMSTFTGNKATNGRGGALVLQGAIETMTVSSSKFTSNTSGIEGGAILIDFQNGFATGNVAIHSSTISNNTSGTFTAADGGGIFVNLANGSAGPGTTKTATIDQETVISGNSGDRGGGIVFEGTSGPSPNNTSLTISKVTITGNHATGATSDGGGGIFVPDAGTLNIQYSRIVDNTTAHSGTPTGMAIEPVGATVNAKDNWWGCNTGPSAAPCDTAAIIGGSGATLTDTPYIILSLGASPTTLQPQPPGTTTSTLTADFLHEASPSGSIAVSNLDVLLGLPITFGATHGTISGAQTTIQSTGTATANVAPDTSCLTPLVASATVDHATPTADITVVCPDLTATKANSLGVLGVTTPLSSPTWTWTITVQNSSAATSAPAEFPNGATILGDSLPSTNITYGSPTLPNFNDITNSTNISCGIASNVLTCSANGAAVTIGTSAGDFRVSFTATATAAGSYTNPTGGSCAVNPIQSVIESNYSNNSCSDTVTVVAPPTISKAFGASGIGVGGTTTLTFTLTNPSANTVAESGVAFSDTLTGGLQVAGTPNLSNGCGGTFSGATSGSTSLSLSSGTIAINSSCTISLNVTGTTAGTISNTTNAVSSTNGGTGAASNTASLTVANPPTISKSFTLSSIPLNGTTTLNFSIVNPNSTLALSGVIFSDTLPGGVQVAGTPSASNSCGGTFTPASGNTSISLSGGSVGTTGPCSLSVNVTGITAGVWSNTTGTISSTQSGPGTTSNTVTLTVVAPPTITKAFSPSTVPLGNESTVIFTITNPNSASNLNGVGFSDTLTGIQVASTPGATNTCGGTFAPNAGDTSLSLTGGTVTAASSCTLSVNVTAASAGSYPNQTSTITSNEGGTGLASNTATLTVVTPACFVPPSGLIDWWSGENNGNDIAGGNTLTLEGGAGFTTGEVGQAFNFTNAPNTATGQYAQNTAPTGLPLGNSARTIDLWFNTGTNLTASTEAALIEYGAQSAENTFGLIFSGNAPGKLYFYGNFDDLAGITTIQPNTWYHAAVTYDGTTVVLYLNGVVEATKTTTSLNTVLDANGLTLGLRPGSATWNGQIDEVEIFNQALSQAQIQSIYQAGSKGKCKANATITKSFTPASIPSGGTSTLGFTITNQNTEVNLTGLQFTDNLPTGVSVASPLTTTNTYGGTFAPTVASGTVSLSGGSVGVGSSNSCTLSVNVTSTTPGAVTNTTGPISSNEAGTGSTSNTVTLTVVAPPTISKQFGASNIALNGTTTLTFTLTNPSANTVAENGVAFNDTLTNGLQVAGTPGLSNGCGGTFSGATASSTSLSLSGGTIAINSSCTITLTVTGTTGGTVTNTTGAVSSTNGGTGATSNTAMLGVGTPPTISKGFSPTSIPLGTNSTLSFTINNPNASLALTGVSFSDLLPSGVKVAGTPGVTNSCNGTVSATAASGTVGLSAGAIAAGGSCAISVKVTGTTAGVWSNTTGAISSDQTGTGATSNTATLTVVGPPTISKAFAASSIPLGTSVNVTFTITNPNTTTGLTGLTFSDGLPSGLPVSGTPNVSNTCNGTVTAAAGTISLTNGTVGFNGTGTAQCSITVSVTGTTAGTKSNTTGAISSTEGGTGTTSNTATLFVVAPPSISKAFGASSIQLNTSTTLGFTITNPAANTVALTGVGFNDPLPPGLAVSNPSVVTGSCGGGTITATASATSIMLAGATINTGSFCTFSVSVTGTADGPQNNTTGAVTSANGGTGNMATASVTVTSKPFITTQPTNKTVCEDTNVTFTAAASGVPTPTVQWQVSFDGGVHWYNIPGATSTTLKFPAPEEANGTKYRAVFTNTFGSTATNAATLTVNTEPEITTQPNDQEVRKGQKVTFTAAANGRPTPTVQWQVSTNGGKTWTNISGATSTKLTFTATAAQDENRYRAVFTDPCGKVTTRAATLDVD